MSDKPKRNFWQIHLGTLLVEVVVAGLLLYPNVCFRACDEVSVVRGWPYAYGERPVNPKERWIDYWKIDPELRRLHFVADAAICIAILIACGVFSEWLPRRREARKP